ncbi:amidase [Ensifer adhaerens]|uniref:Indoleacetamide hydrolase n=1 Tax=Ensifer adhaerens TaxID=106592 RepID=A0A9Q8YI43_ENSAD|nr:amidase [Ensifer adhaerens]USJ28505.1 amidase [Ensifer adhaerens]
MEPADLDYASASELAMLVRRRQLSPVEVVDHAIQRIEARNPSLNAFVHTDFEGARVRARALEARIAKGEDIGHLAGVPTAIKDLYNFYPGWPCTLGGVPSLKNFRLDFKSLYPTRMEAAGAIVLGTTNSPALGFRGITDNVLYGPTNNPFDLSRNSGGSSGGSAAAVADGLLPIAGGTDGGGSIRIPSAWCHTFGFQASFGRIPLVMRPNAFGSTSPFIYEGPITRTVEDAALALDALAGCDPADPYSLTDRVDWLAALQKPIAGLRIGFTPDFGGFPVEPTVSARITEAVEAFDQAGAEIVPLSLDFAHSYHELSRLWCRMMSQGTVAVLEGFAAEGIDLERDLPEIVLDWMRIAKDSTLREHQRDQIMRTNVYDVLNRAFSEVDLIAGPTTACLAVMNRERGETVGPYTIDGLPVDPLIGFCPTFLTNFSGNPSASLPAGFANGLPVGLMLIGRRQADAALLSACAAYERIRPWTNGYEIAARRLAS